jgi:ribosomal-protein-alanine N-acetyltransferase
LGAAKYNTAFVNLHHPPPAWHGIKFVARLSGKARPSAATLIMFVFSNCIPFLTMHLIIETRRLRLLALNHEQLQLLLNGRAALEQSMGLAQSNLQLNTDENFLREFSRAIAEYNIPKVLQHPVCWAWFTHWLIIEKSENLAIGGIGASGLPDDNAEVMIGYFVDAKFEGRGYATEAVRGFTTWIFSHSTPCVIIADTPASHIASQKVLRKAGFTLSGEVAEGIRWRLAPH